MHSAIETLVSGARRGALNRIGAIVLAFFALNEPCSAAESDPPVELDAIWRVESFTSPLNAYGAWTTAELRARFQVGSNSPGIDVINQADANSVVPQHGQYAVLDDYHEFRPGLFVYGALGSGSGTAVPLHSAYGEVDMQVLHVTPLLLGMGGAVSSSADGTVARYISAGPTLYFNGGNATLRYIPTSSKNAEHGAAGLLTLQIGPQPFRSTVLTLQFGTSPPFLAQSGNRLAGSERAIDLDIASRRRVSRELGILCGVDYGHVVAASTGHLVYVRRGLSLGLVWSAAPQVR